MLNGRRILVGVTGGIAAYKSVHLVRLLSEQGADLRVVRTAAARRFVGDQTFEALTGKPVSIRMFHGGSPSPHTDLARWAEAVVVAPATANTLAKLATGLADDLLSATLLATRAPVLLAPAMHTEMWEHPATRRNVERLAADGYTLAGPATGPLAGGDSGPGRMAEPEEILTALLRMLGSDTDLAGWRVLVTAGGTREPIDPVRFIGNRSSGKMGTAIAREAAHRGAAVTLVTTRPELSGAGIETVAVESAAEMAGAVWDRLGTSDVVVMAAAVADFRPKAAGDAKLRRSEGPPDLVLEATPDILAGIAAREERPFLVGFAAEAGGLTAAYDKARSKGVDLLVANDVAQPGSGFGSDTNEVTIIRPDGSSDAWPQLPKQEVARRLWDLIRTMREPA